MSSEISDYGLTETTENYLKKIYTLSIQNEFARVSDIAKHMDRSLSTVTGAVQRMAQEGLLNYEKYGKITLTEKGEEIAISIHYSYSTMKELLVIFSITASLHLRSWTLKKVPEFLSMLILTNNGLMFWKAGLSLTWMAKNDS